VRGGTDAMGKGVRAIPKKKKKAAKKAKKKGKK
jgi:hypothetical protein